MIRCPMRTIIFCLLSSLILISCGTGQLGMTDLTGRYYPGEYKVWTPIKIHSENNDIAVDLYSRSFAQGDVVYVEVMPAGENTVRKVSLTSCDRSIPMTEKAWGYRGFFAVNPAKDPCENNIVVNYSCGGAKELPISFAVRDAHFKVVSQALDLGAFSNSTNPISPELQAFIEECTKLKRKAFTEKIPDCITASLSHPRDKHYITSEFFSQRVYMRYRYENGKRVHLKDTNKIHYGVDLRGPLGSPVFAITSGKITLSALLHYEGNMIVVNHGDGIYSYYMHMSKRIAPEGTFVRGGQKIGEVGSTGVSTGPHLHVALVVHGVDADPLSLICLPIRN